MFKLFGLLGIFALIGGNAMAAQIQNLPAPDKVGGMPLMQSLNQRQSVRNFSDEELDTSTLSNILWAAYGINRDNGGRTIPTALNQKDLSLYVAKKDGVWLYNAEKNVLQQITEENILPLFNTQSYMSTVPLVLIYVGSDKEYAAMHAGSSYQNVGLYAASAGLANVVRGYFDKEAVSKFLKLDEGQRPIVSQAIGKPVKQETKA